MNKIQIDGQVLRFVFNRLKLQEGVISGKATSNMDCELIFKILVNAKYKQEHDIVLTELEKTVKKESGNFITMYVQQKYEEAKKDGVFTSLPFDEISHLTLSDLEPKKPRGYAV